MKPVRDTNSEPGLPVVDTVKVVISFSWPVDCKTVVIRQNWFCKARSARAYHGPDCFAVYAAGTPVIICVCVARVW